MYPSYSGACVVRHELPLSDTSDSDSDYEWQFSREHLIAVEEKYKYLHAKHHTDYTAISFKKTGTLYSAQIYSNPCNENNTSQVTKTFCAYLPERSTEPIFQLPRKRISFRKTSFQRSFTYKSVRRTQPRRCKQQKFHLFVNPRKLFYCHPTKQQSIQAFDVSVLYPKQYKWTKSDACFVFDDSENEPDEDCVLSDSTDCTNIVLKAIENRYTTMSQIAFSSDTDNNYKELVDVHIKKDFQDLHITDSTSSGATPVRFPKSRSLCDEIDVNAPLSSLKTQLKHQNKLKRQLISSYHEQLKVLKRIKLELQLCYDRTNEIDTQIDLRQSLLHTKTTKKLSTDLTTKLDKIASDVKPLDSLFDESITDVKKEEININIELGEITLKKKYKCAICKKGFTDQKSFTDHLENHTGVRFKCDKCDSRSFSSSKSLSNHMQFHKRGEVYLVCTICKKQFELTAQLNSHKKVHAPPSLPCRVHEHCDKIYTFEDQRTQHELYHGKPKKYQCATCERYYTSPGLLRQHHMREAHSGQITQPEDQA